MFSEELKLVFTNVSFLAFLIVLVPTYFLIPKKWQWGFLLFASYVFYFFTSSALPIYMIITTVTIFFAARKMDRIEQDSASYLAEHKAEMSRDEKKEYKKKVKSKKKVFLLPTVVINLGMLVILKYGNMFIGSINSVFSSNISAISLILPLGISYYTLQSLGYLIDVYRAKYRSENNIFRLALFVSFFAHIIQGPFSRFDQLAHQLYEKHSFSYTRLKSGLTLALWGYFKKLVIADLLSPAVNGIFDNMGDYNGLQLLCAAMMLSLQVYADFSGYMDIATGVCEILGIELAKNFDRPFFSKSVEEYWRRWHITLGAWFKDYVFFPLSVSKVAVTLSKNVRKKGHLKLAKLLPSYIALLFVWSLTGLWHGASWRYVIWGAGNCLFIMMSMQFETLFTTIKTKLKINESNLAWRTFQMVRTFLLLSLLRSFPKLPTVSQSLLFYKKIFTLAGVTSKIGVSTFFPNLETPEIMLLVAAALTFYVISLLQFKYPKVRLQLFKKNYFVQSAVLLALIFVILIFGTYGPGIDVAGFVYAQF